MNIGKYNHEGYKDPTPYEAHKREKDPKNQYKGYKARAVGLHFEDMISAACRFYEDKKIAIIEKTPEPMRPIKNIGRGRFVAYFEKQAQPDYKGTLKDGKAIVFEAKHSGTNRIEKNRLSREQFDRLKKHSELGAKTFILVSINLEYFYRVPFYIWEDMQKIYGHKHMTLEELEPFKVKTVSGIIRFLE